MKLENNSLKYGMNVDNNVTSTYNNAYQNEMANQRDMQSQITQRQKTLLEAINNENTTKLQMQDRLFGYNPNTGTYAVNPAGMTKDEAIANLGEYTKAVNENIKGHVQPYGDVKSELRDTIPATTIVDPNGDIQTIRGRYPYPVMTGEAVTHPDYKQRASLLGWGDNTSGYLRMVAPWAKQQPVVVEE